MLFYLHTHHVGCTAGSSGGRYVHIHSQKQFIMTMHCRDMVHLSTATHPLFH